MSRKGKVMKTRREMFNHVFGRRSSPLRKAFIAVGVLLFAFTLVSQGKAATMLKDPTAPEVKPIEPKPVTINPEKSALLVLESVNTSQPILRAPLVPGVTRLLERARASGILIVFTVPHPFKGTPYGKVYSGFERRASEALFFPEGFDKFSDGKLKTLLGMYDIDTLVITGIKANMAILYTASKAAAEYGYKVVIPVDGIGVLTDYEKEYTLYQFRRYPAKVPELFTFTNLDMISFRSGKKNHCPGASSKQKPLANGVQNRPFIPAFRTGFCFFRVASSIQRKARSLSP
jgi:nicotinamidase-related amidase